MLCTPKCCFEICFYHVFRIKNVKSWKGETNEAKKCFLGLHPKFWSKVCFDMIKWSLKCLPTQWANQSAKISLSQIENTRSSFWEQFWDCCKNSKNCLCTPGLLSTVKEVLPKHRLKNSAKICTLGGADQSSLQCSFFKLGHFSTGLKKRPVCKSSEKITQFHSKLGYGMNLNLKHVMKSTRKKVFHTVVSKIF